MRGHLQLFASGPNNEDAVDLRGAGRPRWNLLAKTSQTHPTRSVFVFQKRSVETSWKLRTQVTQIFSTSGVASEVSANSATIFLHDPWHCFRDCRDPTLREGSDSSGILCLIRPLLECQIRDGELWAIHGHSQEALKGLCFQNIANSSFLEQAPKLICFFSKKVYSILFNNENLEKQIEKIGDFRFSSVTPDSITFRWPRR